MHFLDLAKSLFPYWVLGAVMFYSVYKSSFKDLLGFNWKSFGKFFLFILAISVYRYFTFKLAISQGIDLGAKLGAAKQIPLGAVLFTPWEDLCHSLPLVILRRVLGTSKWMMPIHYLALAVVMISFSLGHLYQGLLPAMLLSLYIPFGMSFGQKKGFGTLSACHVLYDFSTLSIIKLLI